MDIREVDRGDEGALRRFWEIGRLAAAATRPFDFHLPWESALATWTQGRAGFRDVLLAVHDGTEMVGRASLGYSDLDNTHVAHLDVAVDPARWRSGFGSAALTVAEQRARHDGRRTLVLEAYAPLHADSPGLAFALAHGFRPALEDRMKVVDLVATEPTWDALEAEVRRRAAGYSLVEWTDRVPAEHVEGYCRINEAFLTEMPLGELDLEPEAWTPERVRTRNEQSRRGGRRELTVAALDPDGSMVGLTEVVLNEHAPHRGFQSGTLVVPAHRGRALGLLMKLRNHRRLRADHPACTVLVTGNAGVNVAMNAVNARLGYRDVERCVELQRVL
ncbi:MAG TPA: GNAT family N-acetyltransferase [Nocardioides sp.]|nr:GNAT family N-acetyltransferase [Nocardioides sp.]